MLRETNAEVGTDSETNVTSSADVASGSALYVYPALSLAVHVSGATRVTRGMLLAGAETLARYPKPKSNTRNRGLRLALGTPKPRSNSGARYAARRRNQTAAEVRTAAQTNRDETTTSIAVCFDHFNHRML
eukprot:1945818-Rhodomonas_salina.1